MDALHNDRELPQTPGRARLLLVDDQPANLLALRSILEDLGHTLVEARSGEDALYHLDEGEFAVVLLDVQMPGINGFETAQLIRARDEHRHTPIIFLTAYDSDKFPVAQAYALGAVDYLVKPLVPVVVRGKVAVLVELYEKAEQVRRQAETIRQLERQAFEQQLAAGNVQIEEQREHYRVTLASIGDAVIASDAEGRVTFLNNVASALTGWSEEQAKGAPLPEVFRIVNEQTRNTVENPALRAVRDGVVVGLANHTILIARDGTEHPIDDSAAPIRDAAGVITGAVLVFRDITQRKRAEEELEEQLRLLQLGSEVGRALIEVDSLPHMLNHCAEALVQHLHGAFARIWTLNPDNDVLELQASAGLYTHLDGPHSHVRVGEFKIGLIAQERKAHLTNRVVGDPRVNDQAWAKREGMVSFAGYPLVVEDQLVGVMAMFGREPLTETTLAAMASVANKIALGIERKQADAGLRQSEARKAAIVETALDCIITADHEGRIVEFNPAAEKTFGYTQAQAIGKEIAELIIPPALRARHRRGMAHYLATGEGPVLNKRIELPAIRADGREFPIELAITPIVADGPPMFTAYLRDISEKSRQEQHRDIRNAVTQLLAEAGTVNEIASGTLRVICDGLGWDFGAFWALDAGAEELRCLESWHASGSATTPFESLTRSRTFGRAVGLPGRVWATGQPAWISDVTQEGEFSRASAASQAGLHSGLACPVSVGSETIGVIEFFSHQIREPDADLLDVLHIVAGLVGQFIKRTRAEEQIRQSQQELSDFFDNATVGLHWVGAEGTVLRVNQAELDMLGYARDEVVGRAISDFHADQEVICDILNRLQSGEQPQEYPARLRRKDGAILEVLIDSSVRWTNGTFAHTRCFTRDVTARNRAERTSRFLADASATLAALVDFESTLQKVASLAVPYFADWATIDLAEADGTLRRVAVAHIDPAKVQLAHELHRRFPADPQAPQGAWHILRTSKSELIPEISETILSDSVKDEELLDILRELGLQSYMGVPLKARDATIGVITFIAAESGHRYDAADLAVAEDLASRAAIAIENSQLYRELKDADARKDEFLATLAHELRNPLAPIRNALHIIRLAGSDAEAIEESRGIMERQLSQMVRLVDDLLDVSRITRNKLELRKQRVELSAVIASAVETSTPLIEQAGHALSVDLPTEPILLDADPTRLSQVFSNLLNNSAKYTDSGGKISVTGEYADEGHVVVKVRDNGLGIPADVLPRVFEMFSQAHRDHERAQGGLGIGLTLVRRLIEMHGGAVEAYSDGPGLGSEFAVRLPIVKQQTRGALATPSVATSRAHATRRILVVDDNHDSAATLAKMLSMMGHETRTAGDGLEAVEMAETFQPDLMLLDIGLPKLNGYGACRRIRQQTWGKRMIIVALTGWGQEEDRRQSKDAGFTEHMVKPVDIAALDRLLSRF